MNALPAMLFTLPLLLSAGEMKVVIDRDLLAGIKQKTLFENIDD